MLMKGKGILPKHDLSNRIVIRLSDHRMVTLNKICTLADWEDPDLYNMMLEIFPLNPPIPSFSIYQILSLMTNRSCIGRSGNGPSEC